MRKRKKTRSGMTLIEIIVSLAILSVMTLVLVKASHAINTYMRSANNVDRKVAQQAPVAEVKYKASAHALHDDVTIKLDVVNDILDSNGIKVGEQVKCSATVNGETYAIQDPSTVTRQGPGDNLNMKFIILKDPVTTAASPAPGPATTTTTTP